MTINYTYRMYGRSKGRGKNNKITDHAVSIKVKKIDTLKYNIIDIGPGYGESTLSISKTHRSAQIIACEKFIDGINNTLNKIQTDSIENLFIFHGNANQFLDENCVDKSISEIWILFPDPWPKKRHFKRRLINLEFIKKLKKLLKQNAKIHIASDSKSYIAHILDCVHKIKKDFKWINQSKQEWEYASLSLPKTKYYKKALKNGRNSFYIKLMKL